MSISGTWLREVIELLMFVIVLTGVMKIGLLLIPSSRKGVDDDDDDDYKDDDNLRPGGGAA